MLLGVCLVLFTIAPIEAAPAPAPFTVEALIAGKLLGLAGLNGKYLFLDMLVTLLYIAKYSAGYLIGNAVADRRRIVVVKKHH